MDAKTLAGHLRIINGGLNAARDSFDELNDAPEAFDEHSFCDQLYVLIRELETVTMQVGHLRTAIESKEIRT